MRWAIASVSSVVLITLCCVTLTFAFDGLWFGSLPDVVETTPHEVEIKTSRVNQSNVKSRLRPSSPRNSSVTSTRQRVTSFKRRVNASPTITSSAISTEAGVGQVKNVTQTKKTQSTPISPSSSSPSSSSVESNVEVTYWETGNGGVVSSEGNSNNGSSSNEDDGVSVSVKEHDRSPHPSAFSGGGMQWFERFKNTAESVGPSESVSVAGYQSKEESAIKGSDTEATVQIKEHDEPGAGSHFSFSPSGGGGDESALWFGGGGFGDDSGHSSKTEVPSPSSSFSSGDAGGEGGGGGGGWFGLDDWAPLSVDTNTGHRQQRRLNYRQTSEDEQPGDIITAAPESAGDTFSFVVNSNLGGGDTAAVSKSSSKSVRQKDESPSPIADAEEEMIITAEPSVVEDGGWFNSNDDDDERGVTSLPPTTPLPKTTPTTTTTATTTRTTTTTITTTTPTTTVKPRSIVVSISKSSTVNRIPPVTNYTDVIDSVNDNNDFETTPESVKPTAASINLSNSEILQTSTEPQETSPSEETIFDDLDSLSKWKMRDSFVNEQEEVFGVIDSHNRTAELPIVYSETTESALSGREGREYESNGESIVENNVGESNLTKMSVVKSDAGPKIIKNGPLTSSSSSSINRDNRLSSDNTAYIIVGSCCAVSLLCLVIVVAIIRYRKSIRRRHRQSSCLHYPIDRDPRFCQYEHQQQSWNTPNTSAFVQGPKSGRHYNHHHEFNAPVSTNEKPSKHLWFIGQKRSAPYSLCEQPHYNYMGEPQVQDGGRLTSSSSHASGLESMNKGS
ncbi:hypothetical protein CHUAL_005457 [Chamberlinius hualienensis]